MGPPSGVPGGFGDPTPAEPEKTSSARAIALVTAIVLVVAGVAIGVTLSGSDGGAALEDVVPASAVVFAKADLSPPGDQRGNVEAILERFPTPEEGVADFIRNAFDELLREQGLSYDADIEPWLGDELGVAVTGVDLTGGEPRVSILASVRDEGSARTALGRVKDRVEAEGETLAFDVQQGAAFIAEDLLSLEQAVAVVDRGSAPLGESPDFAKALDRLGRDNLAFVWIDATSIEQLFPPGTLPGLPGAGFAGKQLITLRAEPDAVILDSYAVGQLPINGGAPTLLESSSSDLIGSLTFYDLAGVFDQLIDAADLFLGFGLGGGGFGANLGALPLGQQAGAREMVADALDQFLALDLDRDVLPWLRGEFSVVVGSAAFPNPEVGALIESTDDEAARRTVDALRDRLGLLGSAGGFEVTSAPGGFAVTFEQGFSIIVRRIAGRVVIASSDEYADELLGGASAPLADDPVYQRAVGPPGDEDVTFQMFVRMDRIASLVGLLGGAEASSVLDRLEAFGLRARTTENEATLRMVVTFK